MQLRRGLVASEAAQGREKTFVVCFGYSLGSQSVAVSANNTELIKMPARMGVSVPTASNESRIPSPSQLFGDG